MEGTQWTHVDTLGPCCSKATLFPSFSPWRLLVKVDDLNNRIICRSSQRASELVNMTCLVNIGRVSAQCGNLMLRKVENLKLSNSTVAASVKSKSYLSRLFNLFKENEILLRCCFLGQRWLKRLLGITLAKQFLALVFVGLAQTK